MDGTNVDSDVNGPQLAQLSISDLSDHHHLQPPINFASGYDADEIIDGIAFVDYRDESQLHDVMRLVGTDLSEPYSSKIISKELSI